MPQLRKDPVTREWVIIAEERSRRPGDFQFPREVMSDREPRVENCPFCPGNELMTPGEVLAFRDGDGGPNSPGWSVRVVPNKFPALSSEGDLGRRGQGMYDLMNAVGAHEVVIETPAHNQSLEDLELDHCADVLWAIRTRFQELAADRRLKYILFFRNHGRVAGASLEHPHSQIIALPMLPRDVMVELQGVSEYSGYRDRCPYCDMLNQELEHGTRVVFSTDRLIAFVPYAAKSPFEIWIAPREHQTSFAELERSEMQEVARALQGTLLRLRHALHSPPYNLAMHTVPVNTSRPEDFHWHIQISPRLTAAAGFEMGTGVYINVTSPEEAARFLREAVQ